MAVALAHSHINFPSSPRMLPPELSTFDISSQRNVIRMDGNPLDHDLADQLKLGVSHVLDYIRSDIYQA